MRTVRDGEGRRYRLLKRSSETSLVRDVETGETRSLANDEWEAVDGDAPLAAAAAAVDPDARALVTAVGDERTLGLLVRLVAEGPLSVRRLLGESELCESDLHGTVGELRAAGLVEPATVAGRRGYAATDAGAAAVAAVADDRALDGDDETDENAVDAAER